MTPELIQEERIYYFSDEGNRKVSIKFVLENNSGLKSAGDWRFCECFFSGVHTQYALEDWKFLADVYKKINEIMLKLK